MASKSERPRTIGREARRHHSAGDEKQNRGFQAILDTTHQRQPAKADKCMPLPSRGVCSCCVAIGGNRRSLDELGTAPAWYCVL